MSPSPPAENAMEQLATGLNKAAETMSSVEEAEVAAGAAEAGAETQPVPDVASLRDEELFQVLEEAYSYKRPRDRHGKSEIFLVSENENPSYPLHCRESTVPINQFALPSC